MEPTNSLLQRLAGYSASAIAMAALTSNISAQTYSGLKNITVDNDTIDIDLDGDGKNDFSFSNRGSSIYNYNKITSLDIAKNKWVGDPMVAAFDANAYSHYTYCLSTNAVDNLGGYMNFGNFYGKGDKYIKVRFNTNDVGWIRINVAANISSFIVRDWAYIGNGIYTGSMKPTLSSTSVNMLTNTTAKLNLTSNAEGKAYYAVQLAPLSTVPTTAQIKAGTGFAASGNGNISSNIPLSLDITGLTKNSAYRVYFYVENTLTSGNTSTIGHVNFTTLATSANELQNDTQAIHLFPNPSHGSIQITVPHSSKYKILNILGSTLKEGTLPEGKSTLDIGNLPKGNYFVQFEVKGEMGVKRLVVE